MDSSWSFYVGGMDFEDKKNQTLWPVFIGGPSIWFLTITSCLLAFFIKNKKDD